MNQVKIFPFERIKINFGGKKVYVLRTYTQPPHLIHYNFKL